MIAALRTKIGAKRDELVENDKGFTLIELLVVVLIIGILAAIAIPVFLGQQDQAKDSAIKSDLGNAKIAMISAATAANGVYPAAADAAGTKTALSAYGYTASNTAAANQVFIKTGGASFCLQGTSASSGAKVFHITAAGGVEDGPC